MYQEKRRAPRAPGEKIGLKIYAEDLKPYLSHGKLEDISTRGLCFFCGEIFSPDEKLILEFTLWKKLKFFLLGRIVWRRKEAGEYRYGLEFIRVAPVEEIRLRKYVHSHFSKVPKLDR